MDADMGVYMFIGIVEVLQDMDIGAASKSEMHKLAESLRTVEL